LRQKRLEEKQLIEKKRREVREDRES